MSMEQQETPAPILGKADRFHKNPILRDQEWNRAKQPPWWLMIVAVVVVSCSFFIAVFAQNPAGWVIGIAMIVVYFYLDRVRRDRARQHLRQVHGQTAS